MITSSLLYLAFSIVASPVAADDKRIKVDPAMLIGVWEVVKADQPPVGSTVEFGGNGKYESNPKGNGSGYLGTYKVIDNQVMVEPAGITITITELTKTKLVIDGSTGTPIEYRRKGAAVASGPRAVQKKGGFTLGAQPKVAADGKWVLVKSDKGDFTVEMPGQPNGHENESGGGFEISSLSYQTPSSEYIVMSVSGPTEVPKAEEAKAMERLRSKAASTLGTGFTVISEDTTQLGSIEGRAFQFAVDKPEAKNIEGVGRSFTKGKTIYVVLGINKKVPEQAYKFVNSLILTGNAGGNTAKAELSTAKGAARKAGIGKAEVNVRKVWGKEIDPDGDVKLTRSGQSLTMQIPGTPHVLAPERDKMNAPRVLAPVLEDFVVSVQVDGAFQPSDKSTLKGLSSRQAAGLILWKDAKNYLVLQRRASVGDEGKDTNQAVLEELVSGNKGVTHRQAIPEGVSFLRLERQGGKITAAFSKDGKDWKEMKSVDAAWAQGELQVGVVAVNTSTGPHKVTFDGYSLQEK